MGLDEYRQANRDNWDSRAEIHYRSDVYDIQRYITDADHVGAVVRFDSERLGDVRGKRLVHLQCHIGTDSVGWARLGADVTGIDLSPVSLAAARRLSADSGTPVRFIETELYETPNALPERFDVVYTGVGALCWLPDIRAWATVVADLLVPGGTFYMREGHPVLWALDIERDDDLLVIAYPYFETPEPLMWSEEETYAGNGTVDSPISYEWNHGMAETLQALIDAGLRIDHVAEYDSLEWEAGPVNQTDEHGRYRLPENRAFLPLMWSVRATKT